VRKERKRGDVDGHRKRRKTREQTTRKKETRRRTMARKTTRT
jgi:hypothetical protein